MSNIEALSLRRCYPVPVRFAYLRRARGGHSFCTDKRCRCEIAKQQWTAALKEATGAVDEVYAVVDGQEVRVGLMTCDGWQYAYDPPAVGARAEHMDNLLDKADRAGYWERPREVRLSLV